MGESFTALIATVVLALVVQQCIRRCTASKDDDESMGYCIIGVLSGIATLVSGVLFFVSLSTTIGAMVSPTGFVTMTLIEALQAKK